MAVSVNETEFKYEAPAEAAPLTRLEGLPKVASTSGPHEMLLEAVYYDTDDLRLLRAKITLRQRRGGDDAGWHLKLPRGSGTRREVRLPSDAAGGPVPAELTSLVRGHSRGEPLRPVARIATRRQLTILRDADGESLAEVADDDVSAQTMGDSATLTRWHEVEVELTGGARRLLRAADKLLRREGLLPASWSAKLERALGRQPQAAGRTLPGSSASAGQVVLAYLRAQAEALTSLDPLVRRDEPDSVHKMRVATRRLRSALRSFGCVLSRDSTRQLAAELKWLGSELGEARDGEVLAAHLQAGLAQLPAEQVIGPIQARVHGHFASVRATARTELIASLDSERYFSLLDQLAELLADPPFAGQADRPATEVLPAAARQAYRQVRRRMRRAGRASPGQHKNVALHQARKAVKRARYAGEAMAPAVGGKARRFTKRVKKLQSVLGEHQDTVIARKAARELGIGAHLAGENAFSYGVLYGLDSGYAGRLQDQARRAWKRVSRP